jgi:hypothetical protein
MDDKNKKVLESLMEKKTDVEIGEELFDLKSQISNMESTLSQLKTSNMASGSGNQGMQQSQESQQIASQLMSQIQNFRRQAQQQQQGNQQNQGTQQKQGM